MAEEYPFLGLLALCFIMFAGSLAFAYIPYAFTLSPRKVRLMSVFGAGLLVGTALIVVVPEGVHMMWSAAQQASREHAHRAPQAGPSAPVSASHADHAPMPAASPMPTAPLHAQNSDGIIGSREGLTAVPRALQGAAEPRPEAHAHHAHADGALEGDHSHDDHDGHAAHGPSEAHAHAHGHEDSFHSATIGLSLAAGFVFMLLVDRIGGGSHGHTHGGGGDADMHYAPNDDEAKGPPAGSAGSAASNTLIGLLIHSAVDGVAMGVSAVSGGASSAVSLIVFAAIMMHKGPAAFGLASFMLQDRLPRHLGERCDLRARLHTGTTTSTASSPLA